MLCNAPKLMKKLKQSLMALGLASVMFLTACGFNITGVSIGLPETMEKGTTGMATPEYAYSGATPEQAKIDELVKKVGMSYSSSDPNVVMVDTNGNLVAVNAGTAEVALASADGEIYASGVIKVVVTPTGISMPDTLTLSMGSNENASVEATVMPEDATDFEIRYTSSDENVLTVTEDGYITAVSAGEADVSAEIVNSGMAAICHVIVSPAIESLEISNGSMTMRPEGTDTLTINVTPENVDTSSVKWTSSDESVVTVDNQGNVTAIAEGTATITASLNGVDATCEVTVKNKTSNSSSQGAGNTKTENGTNNSGNEAAGSNNTSEPAAASTAYGAVPFSAAAGTSLWFDITAPDAVYDAVLTNMNNYRAAVGAPPLSMDSGLMSIAITRCHDMIEMMNMSHDGHVTDEIIAQNWNSAQAVVDAWAASPGHYAAMVDPNYTSCGIGCSFEENGATYWCVTFQ